MGVALTAPVENMSEMGCSKFTACAQPYSYVYILVLRARQFFEVVFEGQPRGVALVTRMADVYERRGVCRTMVFLQNHAKF